MKIFHYSMMQIARRVSPQPKIWGSGSGSLASSFTLFGPFAEDSHGQQHALVQQHVAETGMEFMDAAFKVRDYKILRLAMVLTNWAAT